MWLSSEMLWVLPAGQEAAVHAIQKFYELQSVEGLLLVDARKAFTRGRPGSAAQYQTPLSNFFDDIAELISGFLKTFRFRQW